MNLLFSLLAFLLPSLACASLVYAPSNFKSESAKLVVVIHGCLQSPEYMALGSSWNSFADQNNLVILYPQVPAKSNPMDCWNWYLPENQKPESGQLKELMNEIKATKQNFHLPSADVFLAGISSGSATVAGLLACFPNEFKAGAMHSSPSYGLAQTLNAGEKILKQGPAGIATKGPCKPNDFAGSVLVIQGSTDPVVHPSNAQRIILDFMGHTTPLSSKETKTNGLTYSSTDYQSDKKGRGRWIQIYGLGHTCAGFGTHLRHKELIGPQGSLPTHLPFFTVLGPSSTSLIWDFFKGH